MYLVEGPKVLYRLALSALKVYSIHGAVSEDTPLHSHVSVLLCTLSPEEKTQWFHDAFNIQLASWSKLLSSWNVYLTAVKRSSFAEHDGVSQSHDGLTQSYDQARGTYQRKITADKDSEVLNEDSWPLVWGWLPDWITTENPECVFRSSRDGYKSVFFHYIYQYIPISIIIFFYFLSVCVLFTVNVKSFPIPYYWYALLKERYD